MGQVLTRTSPDTGLTSYSYDTAGRLGTETKSNGQVLSYSWDSANRPTGRSTSGGSESYFYNEGVNGKGHLTHFTDASGQTSFTYQPDGQLATQVAVINGQTYTTLSEVARL